MATVLITAGATREHLDDVRFLTNGSTGRMGYAVARAAVRAGHESILVSAPTALAVPDGVEATPVVSALEMEAAVQAALPRADVVYGVAAVADARPAVRHPGKPPKTDGPQVLELVPNPDIIAGAARVEGRRAIVGFALEAVGAGGMDDVFARAERKLARKGLDAIAVNTPAALAADESEVVVLYADGRREVLPVQSKDETAARLIEVGTDIWQQKQ